MESEPEITKVENAPVTKEEAVRIREVAKAAGAIAYHASLGDTPDVMRVARATAIGTICANMVQKTL